MTLRETFFWDGHKLWITRGVHSTESNPPSKPLSTRETLAGRSWLTLNAGMVFRRSRSLAQGAPTGNHAIDFLGYQRVTTRPRPRFNIPLVRSKLCWRAWALDERTAFPGASIRVCWSALVLHTRQRTHTQFKTTVMRLVLALRVHGSCVKDVLSSEMPVRNPIRYGDQQPVNGLDTCGRL